MSPASNKVLRDRAAMLSKVRSFFDEKEVLEVDCPLLFSSACIDEHIDLFEVSHESKQIGYLHSSPEYGMKRLLSQGIGSIYQLSHVYRAGEIGRHHRPEFTMIEWYRPHVTYTFFLKEVIDLLALFIGPQESEHRTYHEAFFTCTNLHYETASIQEMVSYLHVQGIDPHSQERNELLNLIWGCAVEPHLGQNKLTVISDFPADQAALAQIVNKNGKRVAERFEIYFMQKELANGYHELRDAKEQEKRLKIANQKRLEMGKKALPIDKFFLEALQKGLPDCYGVAVGFDRLLMLRHSSRAIDEVLPM